MVKKNKDIILKNLDGTLDLCNLVQDGKIQEKRTVNRDPEIKTNNKSLKPCHRVSRSKVVLEKCEESSKSSTPRLSIVEKSSINENDTYDRN